MTTIKNKCLYCDGTGVSFTYYASKNNYECFHCGGTGDADHHSKIIIGLSLLFGPGLLGILGQQILHSVPSTILTPILIPLTVGVAAYTAWVSGKKLKENLRIKTVWLIPIRVAIFLLISSLVYILFYRYSLYNSICALLIPIYALLALTGAIVGLIAKQKEQKEVGSNTSSSPSLDAASQPKKIAAPQFAKRPTNRLSSISFLLYVGILLALAVQFARANAWSLPLFKSYEDAFATSFFIAAIGIAHTAYIWQNTYTGLGLFLTTIGGFAWEYKWVIPVVKTYEIPLCVGILLVLYGLAPQLLGGLLLIAGTLLLSVELWLAFTTGLATVHYVNLLVSISLIGLSVLMFRRQKRLRQTGVFRNRTTKNL